MLLIACGDPSADPAVEPGPGSEPEPALPAFCDRAGADPLHDLFCVEQAPEITGITDLLEALELHDANMLSHSTGLGSRSVSPINPRIIFHSGKSDEGTMIALAFARGHQRVEVLAQDPQTMDIKLYLLDFEQACNRSEQGCGPGDLFTPAVERDWLELRVRDDEDLKNTPLDCRRCHGGGQGSQSTTILLMRELMPPWMHWFTNASLSRLDYLAAKRVGSSPSSTHTEPYAGVPLPAVLDGANAMQGQVFQATRVLNHPAQPLVFPSGEIGIETNQYRDPSHLFANVGVADEQHPNGPTWQALYDAFLRGEAPAPPYHHDRITDPDKLARVSEAYQDFLAGALERQDLPDLAEVLPDDQHMLAEMGFMVEPGAGAEALLSQACRPCHNDALDPTISRARFNADLSELPSAEIELAIHRLSLPQGDPLRMPPAEARELDDASRDRLVEYLTRKSRAR